MSHTQTAFPKPKETQFDQHPTLAQHNDEPPSGASQSLRPCSAYNRDAVAQFLIENGPRIRRRIRGKLGVVLRRSEDSEDIFSTVVRRLDRYAASGKMHAQSEGELWALVTKVTDTAIVDKLRYSERRSRTSDLYQLAMAQLARAPGPPDASSRNDQSERAIHVLDQIAESENSTDAQIASLWARGLSHVSIAAFLGQDVASIRTRWQLIKRKLRRRNNSA